MWEEEDLACSQVLFQYLPGIIEEYKEKLQVSIAGLMTEKKTKELRNTKQLHTGVWCGETFIFTIGYCFGSQEVKKP
jgi:hypothetical protein